MGQTAIFGGTFNPPHLGHRAMLEWATGLERFDRLLVMPANIPPHKACKIVSATHRLAMCRLAFGDLEKVAFCEEELRLSGKSYTANTLKSLAEKGLRHPTLIIGADSLVDFHRWYRYEEILQLADLLVYLREGIDPKSVQQAAQRLMDLGGAVTLTEYCPPGISSSEVRARLEQRQPADDLLPKAVAEYIQKNELYAEE